MLSPNYYLEVPPLVMSAGSNLIKTGSGASACGDPGSTGTPGASASGGVGALTYLWEQIGTTATTGPYDCSDTAALNPTWSVATVCDADAIKIETWRLTVTDSLGDFLTDTITVSLVWIDTSGP